MEIERLTSALFVYICSKNKLIVPKKYIFLLLCLFAFACIKLSRRQYAEWCLLLTQARDKNYIAPTSDSLIRAAVDYFEHHGPASRQMLAYYYMGRVSQDLQRAENCFRQIGKTLCLSLSLRGMNKEKLYFIALWAILSICDKLNYLLTSKLFINF
jgi:hypothetical protein